MIAVCPISRGGAVRNKSREREERQRFVCCCKYGCSIWLPPQKRSKSLVLWFIFLQTEISFALFFSFIQQTCEAEVTVALLYVIEVIYITCKQTRNVCKLYMVHLVIKSEVSICSHKANNKGTDVGAVWLLINVCSA